MAFVGVGRRTRALVLCVVAILALASCQRSATPTSGEIALGTSVERARGHLANALRNAEAGAWVLAAVHAAHPAEDMPTIDRMLSSKDVGAANALRDRAAAVVSAAQARDLGALRASVQDADRQLAAIPAIVMDGARATEIRYRASVVVMLVGTAADEYGEGIEDGKLANVAEYQDAHAFLERATAIWGEIEGAVVTSAPAEHHEIVSGLARLRAAMPALAPPTSPVASEQVEALAHDVERELREAVGAETGTAAASAAAVEDAVAHLDATSAALRSGDSAAAAASFKAFRSAWIEIEDAVRGRDRDAYRAIETDMATSSTLLSAASLDAATAAAAVARIRDRLAPLATATKTYGTFDAAIILLREGFEALLVIAALLAFLVRSGNADKQKWIWAGGGAGIVASVGVALLIALAFSATTGSGADPELLEGITGLFAAAMLVYVSFWLHSKASLKAWDRYIREKTSSALARKSLVALAAIAFLAVLREGSETALFYIGVASSIAPGELVLGLATGAAGLAAIGILMLGFGVRVPVRPFFLATSVLVYYLAFKFVGSGIHALQVAGIIPATPGGPLPDIGALGVFPTWETTAVQATLLAGAAALLVIERARAVPRGRTPIA